MSDAHKQASLQLGWTSKTYPEANHLARTIMRCFDSGIRELDRLITAAVNSELGVHGLHRRKTDLDMVQQSLPHLPRPPDNSYSDD